MYTYIRYVSKNAFLATEEGYSASAGTRTNKEQTGLDDNYQNIDD